MYFVISVDEDGGDVTAVNTRDELLELFRLDEDCNCSVVDPEQAMTLEEMNDRYNMWEWGERIVIIKGEIVVPESVKVVSDWEIE